MKRAVVAIIIMLTSLTASYLLLKRNERSQLKNEFEIDFMRFVPMDIFTTKSLRGYDVLYQKPDTYSEMYKYPNYYSVGVKNGKWYGYDYVFTLTDIDVFQDIGYLATLITCFKSDTTHVNTIWKENGNVYCAVERFHDGEYWPWKVYSSPYLQTAFQVEQNANEDIWKLH